MFTVVEIARNGYPCHGKHLEYKFDGRIDNRHTPLLVSLLEQPKLLELERPNVLPQNYGSFTFNFTDLLEHSTHNIHLKYTTVRVIKILKPPLNLPFLRLIVA